MIPKLNVPNTNFSFSKIGYGAEQLGLHNWGTINIKSLRESIIQAVDNGVNYFDTADVYGLGQSEKNLSKFLGDRRKSIHIISKFGVRFKDKVRYIDNSPKWIYKAIEKSLRRLKTDYIDLYQLHYWDCKTNLNDIFFVLENLKKQGKIRSYGFSNISANQIKNFDLFFNNSSSFSFEFSLAEKKFYNDIIKLNKKMIFLVYGALGQGILTGKYSLNSKFSKDDRRSLKRYTNFHGKKLKKNLSIVTLLKKISNNYNVSISSIALRYIIETLDNSSIICGIKNKDQLQDNLDVFKFHLNNVEVEQLNKLSNE